MTPSKDLEETNQAKVGKDELPGNLSQSEANVARAADQAAYIPPSRPRNWAGRVVLRLQKVFDKVLAGRVVQLQGQVIEQDRELSDLAHDVGELTTQLIQVNRRLQAIDQRLAGLEATNRPPDPE